jgi:aryl-alcohol dehydrogenase-like predicted oxidoreductase
MLRFQENNLRHNLGLVAALRRLAEAKGCTPSQLALAWVLSRSHWVVPIAGTSHRRWLEENAASDLAISAATQQALDEIFRPGARRQGAISQ